MPYCAILQCKNDSRSQNMSNGGISYHRFPRDPTRKEDWIEATGRINWIPVKSSVICSEHFSEKEFLISQKGHRYLKTTAVPTMKIVTFFDEMIQDPMDAPPGSSKRPATPTNSESETVLPKKKCRPDSSLKSIDAQEEHTSESCLCSTPSFRKLIGQLRWSKDKITNQKLKIRRLQAQNRKLRKQLNNMEQISKTVKK